jgi:FkbH-like protein
MANPLSYTQYIRLWDRFGDLGLTGLLVGFRREGRLRIDSWLMSCRILGRGVEQAMLSAAIAYAWEHGCSAVTGDFIPTAKNRQVRDVYARYGFDPIETGSDGSVLFGFARNAAPVVVPDYLDVKTNVSC